jgi:DNA-binding Lrp family transcriptional regulator
MIIKTDLKDKRIIYELERNSRQNNKQIAKKIGLSEQLTGKRIKRLLEKGIIEFFGVKVNPKILGLIHIKTYIKLHSITEQELKDFYRELKKEKNVFWIAEVRGKYDVVITLNTRTIAEYSKRFNEVVSKVEDKILEKKIVFLEKATSYSRAYLVPGKEPNEIVHSLGTEKEAVLEEEEINLLRILNSDGRIGLIELSKKMNLNIETVKKRIQKLKKQGVITGFVSKIDFRKLGSKQHIIFLNVRNMTEEKYKKMETTMKHTGHTLHFMKTIGDHEIEIELETITNDKLYEIIRKLRDQLTLEIIDYEIIEVIREHKLEYFPF